MPDIILPDTQEDIIAGILRDQRRRKNSSAASRAYLWEFDKFTISGSTDTAHTLTYLPYGVNNVALNGVVLVQDGTDVTINYTTGVVTLAAAPVAGDVLTVSYVTTGELAVLSSTADIGLVVNDTFNRADSTTTVNPASDGGTWTMGGNLWGISSNRAYATATTGGTGTTWGSVASIMRDSGTVAADVTLDIVRLANLAGDPISGLIVSGNPSSTTGYAVTVDSGSDPATVKLQRVTSSSAVTMLTSTTVANWVGASKTFRLTHDGSGNLAVYIGGSSTPSITYTDTAWTTLGTWVGAINHAGAATYDLIDNFQAKAS